MLIALAFRSQAKSYIRSGEPFPLPFEEILDLRREIYIND